MFSLDLTLVFHYPPIRQEIFQKRQIKKLFFYLTQPNLSLSLDKLGCGSAEANLKTAFLFASALTFHYLWLKF